MISLAHVGQFMCRLAVSSYLVASFQPNNPSLCTCFLYLTKSMCIQIWYKVWIVFAWQASKHLHLQRLQELRKLWSGWLSMTTGHQLTGRERPLQGAYDWWSLVSFLTCSELDSGWDSMYLASLERWTTVQNTRCIWASHASKSSGEKNNIHKARTSLRADMFFSTGWHNIGRMPNKRVWCLYIHAE